MQLASCCPSCISPVMKEDTQRRSELTLTSLQQIGEDRNYLSYWANKCKMISTFKSYFQKELLRTSLKDWLESSGRAYLIFPVSAVISKMKGICGFQSFKLYQLANLSSDATVTNMKQKQTKFSTPKLWED